MSREMNKLKGSLALVYLGQFSMLSHCEGNGQALQGMELEHSFSYSYLQVTCLFLKMLTLRTQLSCKRDIPWLLTSVKISSLCCTSDVSNQCQQQNKQT